MAKPKEELRRLIRQERDAEVIIRMLFDVSKEGRKQDADMDRAVGILGGTFLEQGLRLAIENKLPPDPLDPRLKYLFELEDAPYREFAGRVRLARALGIINKSEFDKMELVRLIRNVFAHSMDAITFNTPGIVELISELRTMNVNDSIVLLHESGSATLTMGADTHPRQIFALAIFHFFWKLVMEETGAVVDIEAPLPEKSPPPSHDPS
jgi:hypothetical protein